jgi:hypothetical protein
VTPIDVRRHERSIARKLERFATVLAAGSLCDVRMPTLIALAEGVEGGEDEEAARLHLRHCNACRAAYAAHLRAVRSGALQRRLGQLLPVPPVCDGVTRRRGTPWEAFWDWLTRPFVPDSAVSFAHVAAATRGAGAVIVAKVAAICVAGGAIVGGGAYCVERRVHDSPVLPPAAAKPRVFHVRDAREQPLPSAGRSAAMKVEPRPRTTARSSVPRKAAGTAFASGPTTTQHEREAPITPAVTTSNGASVAEFDPAPANTASEQPAAAPASGAPEFP